MVKYCKNCGSEIKDNHSFCAKCGTPTNSNNPKSSIKHLINNEKIINRLIVSMVIIIIVVSISLHIILTPNENTITEDIMTATIISTDSNAHINNEGEVFYSYTVEGNLFSINESLLGNYIGKAYFYDENGKLVITSNVTVQCVSDNDNQFFGFDTTSTYYNVTKVRVEIMNPQGEIVATDESSFIMGNMNSPI